MIIEQVFPFSLIGRHRVKYSRSFFSYIRRNFGINLLLVCVMSVILFALIIVSGYKEGLEQQDFWHTDSDECEYYTPNELNLTCDQVEEFYQAVSNTVGGIDRLVVQSESEIEIFNYYEEKHAPITSFYPFDMSFISDTLTDVSFEDNHLFLLPYNEQYRLTGYFFHAAESGIIVIDQPSPNEITISLASDEKSAVKFQIVALSFEKISPHPESLLIITSWENMKSTASPITHVSFVVPEALTAKELSEVNRLSKYLLGSEFVLHSEAHAASQTFEGGLLYVGAGLAVYALLPIFLYICNMRKQEFLVFELCGETPWGILFHCLYHFAVLLLFTDMFGIGLTLLFNTLSQRYNLLLIFTSCHIAINVIVFDFLALMICSVRVFISEVRRKDLRL